jgi:hypothetical protein
MSFYGSVIGFRTYHTARGVDTTAYTDAAVEIELLKGSEWLDARYRGRYSGIKYGNRTQIRDWPRSDAYDLHKWSIPYDVIPAEVENATYEVTLKSLQTPGILNKDFTPSKYSQVSVTGAVHVQFLGSRDVADIQTRFATVEQAIAPVLSRSGGSSGVAGESYR